MHDFTDKVVFITGAAGNLGIATAQAFAQAGAKLVLVDRHNDRLQAISKSSGDLLLGSVDLMDPTSVQDAVDLATAKFGAIDVLVHTMGGYRAGSPVGETDLEEWDFMFNLNARPSFIVSKSVLPSMIEKGRGVIVLIGARPGLKGVANAAAYSASKGAVLRLTESLSAEYKHKGIRVNAIIPGTIDTPQNREDMPEGKFERWVAPDALARVILFLASEDAAAVHGASIPVYGTG